MESELRPALLVILLRSSEKWEVEGSHHLTGLDYQQMHTSYQVSWGKCFGYYIVLIENKYYVVRF